MINGVIITMYDSETRRRVIIEFIYYSIGGTNLGSKIILNASLYLTMQPATNLIKIELKINKLQEK